MAKIRELFETNTLTESRVRVLLTRSAVEHCYDGGFRHRLLRRLSGRPPDAWDQVVQAVAAALPPARRVVRPDHAAPSIQLETRRTG
jgi:hypothetical protein